MIREDLLDFKYYLNNLSMFMKESYGTTEMVDIYYQQLIQVNNAYDNLFTRMDIYNSDINEIGSDFLDIIGAIFNCYRQFTVSYIKNGNRVYKNVNLNRDSEFLIYIKCQIVKQNFKGTREELKKLYTTIEYGQILNEDSGIPLYFLYIDGSENDTDSAICTIYWSNGDSYSKDLQAIFLAGELTIESMGIEYYKSIVNVENLAMFAIDNTTPAEAYYKFTGNGVNGGYFA